MKKFVQAIKRVEEILCVALLAIMCVVIFLATVARFTGLFVIGWAEELARYCMIWAVFLGIGVAAASGQHFSVDVLDLFCPRKVRNIIRVICAVLVIGFGLFCAFYGAKVLTWQMLAEQITPSLHWPMWLMYVSIPLGLMLMAICYGYRTYETIINAQNKNEEAKPE